MKIYIQTNKATTNIFGFHTQPRKTTRNTNILKLVRGGGGGGGGEEKEPDFFLIGLVQSIINCFWSSTSFKAPIFFFVILKLNFKKQALFSVFVRSWTFFSTICCLCFFFETVSNFFENYYSVFQQMAWNEISANDQCACIFRKSLCLFSTPPPPHLYFVFEKLRYCLLNIFCCIFSIIGFRKSQ